MQAYLRDCFAELYENDGMMVLGRGLGLPLLFSKFLQQFSSRKSENHLALQHLVLILNAGDAERSVMDLLRSEGVTSDSLPEVINSDVNSQERSDMYNLGGCYFITSRILIVDLLDNKLDASKVSGLLIYNAHRISETSIESFIVRVFREKNQNGFIKAFCEDPEHLTNGYMKVERLLRSLYLQKLFLWPRFRLEVARALEMHTQPDVIELSLPLSKHMLAIQNGILVAMTTCLKELKKSCPSLDTSQWTLENGLFHHFDSSIRAQLDPEWHRIAFRTKQIVSDLTVLRKLLDYLVRYDAFSFYYLLTRLHAASRGQASPSLWLTSAAAELVFKHAKARLYSVLPANSPNKWSRILNVQSVVKPALDTLGLSNVLEPILECPPKWNLLHEVVKEIHAHFVKSQSSDSLRSSTASGDKGSNADSSFSSSPSSSKLSGRVLLVVRDELSLNQLKDVLLNGSNHVMDQRFRWFVSHQSKEITSRQNRARRDQAIRSNMGSRGFDKSSGPPQSDGVGAAEEMDWNDAVIQQIIQETHDIEPPGPQESRAAPTADDSNFLGLGLPEDQVKMLAEDQQLLLLQNRILQMVLPEQSVSTALHERNAMKAKPVAQNVSSFRRADSSNSFSSKALPDRKRKRQKSSLPRHAAQSSQSRLKSRRIDQHAIVFQADPPSMYASSASSSCAGTQLRGCLLEEFSEQYYREHPVRARQHRRRVRGKREDGQGEDGRARAAAGKAGSKLDGKEEDDEEEEDHEDASEEDNDEEEDEENQMDEDRRFQAKKERQERQNEIIANQLHVIIVTHAQLIEHYLTALRELQPRYVILYDADMYIVRSIEAYQSTLDWQMKVYFFVYEGSTEEHRYASAVLKEKTAFDQLIRTKEHMVIALPDHPAQLVKEQVDDLSLIDDSRQRRAMSLVAARSSRAIVVDVREFRSILPSILYASQNCSQLIPRTLWVGDYVLSSEICVERKGISDLFQSFASGRLYNQCEAMSKYYKNPCVLIEFQHDKSFSLIAASDITAEIQSNCIISKIVLLTQSFPSLRLLWSRSPQSTAEIFRSVALHHDPVDVQKALTVGAGSDENAGDGDDWFSSSNRRQLSETDSEEARLTAQEILLALPGINVHNFREVMHKVSNLAELSQMTETQLAPLVGQVNAKKLVAFFRQCIV